MSDKPTIDKWTFEDVAKLWTSGGFEGVAQAHNAALAAERKKYNQAVDHLTQLGVESVAAERKKLA